MTLIEPQTTLLPRSEFIEKLDRAISQCLHTNTVLSLIILDIDHLNQYSAKYGWQAGDEIIRRIGDLFLKAFIGDVIIGHYGGDEFIGAVLEEKPEKVFDQGEQLFLEMDQKGVTIVVGGDVIRVGCTVSMGMATLPTDAVYRDALIDKAKQALYRAKASGGNRITLYEEKDALTGLLNHFGIIRKLDEACSETIRHNRPLSILSIDIDNLKQVNEAYERSAGDEIIKRFTQALTSKFQGKGSCGRLGGDQFLVVLPDCRTDSAFSLAEELRRQIEEMHFDLEIEGETRLLGLRISAGVATFPNDANERVDLIRKAEEALYRAKNTGRNRICLPSSAQMVMKTNYYTHTQLERLAMLAKSLEKSEAFLLREALDDLLMKYLDKQVYLSAIETGTREKI